MLFNKFGFQKTKKAKKMITRTARVVRPSSKFIKPLLGTTPRFYARSNFFGSDSFFKPFEEFESFFQPFFQNVTRDFRSRYVMPMDIKENKTHYIFSTEIPGVKKEDVKISLKNNTLTINVETKMDRKEDETIHLSERAYGNFSRTIPLPKNTNTKDINAEYENGVLILSVPKMEPKEDIVEIKIN